MILHLIKKAISTQSEIDKTVSFFKVIDPEYMKNKIEELEIEYNMILDKLTIALNERGITPEIKK